MLFPLATKSAFYPGRRAISSLVNLSVNNKTGIAQLEMNNHPVNSLGTKLMEDILLSIDEVKKEKCRGMILMSGAKTTFSAGLNFAEVYKAEANAFRKFYYLFQEVNYQLFSAPFLTAAAINGHAPAGGCVMALTTDYRVMVNNPDKPYRIGLNESAIGLAAPLWIHRLMSDVIGRRQTAQALLSSTLFTTDEAFKIGLIDEMATDREEAVEKAYAYLNMYERLPIHALIETKLTNRKEFIDKFESEREFDLINFSRITLSPESQEMMGRFLEPKAKQL